MFDIELDLIQTMQQTRSPQNCNVNIKKPSTSEDLEFLQSMRKDVVKSLIGKIDISNNIINDFQCYIDLDALTRSHVIYVRFKINNELFEVSDSLDSFKVKARHEVYEDLSLKICEMVSKQILNSVMTGLSESILSQLNTFRL